MDVLKEEEQKITLDIDEFINRRAKEGADLAKALSDIEDAKDEMHLRVRCIDAETENLAKEKEEIKVALMENEQRLELFSLKKKLMEEDMDMEMRQLIERKAEVTMILSRLSSTSKMVEFLKTSIKKKEEDLECPICLEPAKPPIFIWCQASHIICSACVPNLEECPQCRMGLTITMKRFFSDIYFFSHRSFPPGTTLLRKLPKIWTTLCGSWSDCEVDPDQEQKPMKPVLERICHYDLIVDLKPFRSVSVIEARKDDEEKEW